MSNTFNQLKQRRLDVVGQRAVLGPALADLEKKIETRKIENQTDFLSLLQIPECSPSRETAKTMAEIIAIAKREPWWSRSGLEGRMGLALITVPKTAPISDATSVDAHEAELFALKRRATGDPEAQWISLSDQWTLPTYYPTFRYDTKDLKVIELCFGYLLKLRGTDVATNDTYLRGANLLDDLIAKVRVSVRTNGSFYNMFYRLAQMCEAARTNVKSVMSAHREILGTQIDATIATIGDFLKNGNFKSDTASQLSKLTTDQLRDQLRLKLEKLNDLAQQAGHPSFPEMREACVGTEEGVAKFLKAVRPAAAFTDTSVAKWSADDVLMSAAMFGPLTESPRQSIFSALARYMPITPSHVHFRNDFFEDEKDLDPFTGKPVTKEVVYLHPGLHTAPSLVTSPGDQPGAPPMNWIPKLPATTAAGFPYVGCTKEEVLFEALAEADKVYYAVLQAFKDSQQPTDAQLPYDADALTATKTFKELLDNTIYLKAPMEFPKMEVTKSDPDSAHMPPDKGVRCITASPMVPVLLGSFITEPLVTHSPNFRDYYNNSLLHFSPYGGGMEDFMLAAEGMDPGTVRVLVYSDNIYVLARPTETSGYTIVSMDAVKAEAQVQYSDAVGLNDYLMRVGFGSGETPDYNNVWHAIATILLPYWTVEPIGVLGNYQFRIPGQSTGNAQTMLLNHYRSANFAPALEGFLSLNLDAIPTESGAVPPKLQELMNRLGFQYTVEAVVHERDVDAAFGRSVIWTEHAITTAAANAGVEPELTQTWPHDSVEYDEIRLDLLGWSVVPIRLLLPSGEMTRVHMPVLDKGRFLRGVCCPSKEALMVDEEGNIQERSTLGIKKVLGRDLTETERLFFALFQQWSHARSYFLMGGFCSPMLAEALAIKCNQLFKELERTWSRISKGSLAKPVTGTAPNEVIRELMAYTNEMPSQYTILMAALYPDQVNESFERLRDISVTAARELSERAGNFFTLDDAYGGTAVDLFLRLIRGDLTLKGLSKITVTRKGERDHVDRMAEEVSRILGPCNSSTWMKSFDSLTAIVALFEKRQRKNFGKLRDLTPETYDVFGALGIAKAIPGAITQRALEKEAKATGKTAKRREQKKRAYEKSAQQLSALIAEDRKRKEPSSPIKEAGRTAWGAIGITHKANLMRSVGKAGLQREMTAAKAKPRAINSGEYVLNVRGRRITVKVRADRTYTAVEPIVPDDIPAEIAAELPETIDLETLFSEDPLVTAEQP